MPPRRSCVLFHVPARGLKRRDLHQFAWTLEREVAQGRVFTCLVTSDEDLRKWNRRFRRQDYPTDVLSFPSPDTTGAELGEIAISFDRARSQAAEHGHTAPEETRILMLHGLLHLLGMDHETDRGRMAREEARWRRHFGLPAGLIERTRA